MYVAFIACQLGVIVGDSGLCCCGPVFNVMCDVNCSSAITSHCLFSPEIIVMVRWMDLKQSINQTHCLLIIYGMTVKLTTVCDPSSRHAASDGDCITVLSIGKVVCDFISAQNAVYLDVGIKP